MGVPKGDPEKGKKLFMRRCAHCHSTEPGGGNQAHAPNLRGIVGRKAGSAPGYDNYTEANKNKSRLRHTHKHTDRHAPVEQGAALTGRNMAGPPCSVAVEL